jgi:hypothetical protein
MVTYFLDDFTGSNGAAWSGNWTSFVSSTGASATIQSNKGRLNGGSSSGPSNKRAQRYSGSNLTDVEISGKLVLTTTNNSGVEVWVRADNVTPDNGNGYFLTFRLGSAVTLSKGSGFTYPTIATVTGFNIAQNTEYGFRLYAVGTTIKAKVWATSGAEPGSYQVSTTDSTHTGSGLTILIANNGGAAGMIADFDDVKLTDGTDNQFTYTGSCTPTAGTFSRNLVTKNPFTGSVTATGLWSYIKVVTRVFTGSITSNGPFKKIGQKVLTGSSTAFGDQYKRTPKTLTGAVTGSGVFRKAFVRKFVGSITTAGTVAATFAGRVFGRPGIVKVTVEKAGAVRMRARRG